MAALAGMSHDVPDEVEAGVVEKPGWSERRDRRSGCGEVMIVVGQNERDGDTLEKAQKANASLFRLTAGAVRNACMCMF